MAKNVKQVYDANPSTSIQSGSLIYLGLSPYGLTNDSAILAENAGLAGLTSGSIIFANSSGNLAQNNSKLIWDNTNFRLGIGGAIVPSNTLTVQGGSYLNGSTSIIGILATTGQVQFANYTTGIAHFGATGIITSSAIDLASGDVTGILPGANGGTNINNSGRSITIGGDVLTHGKFEIDGNFDTLFTLTAGTSLTLPTSGTVLSTANPSGNYVSSITGTANQVIASAATGAVTLSLPQSIATTSSPSFAALTAGSIDNNVVGLWQIGTTNATSIVFGQVGQHITVNSSMGLTGTSVNQLIYVTSPSNLTGLATANNGMLVTSNTGVPSIAAAGTALSISSSSLSVNYNTTNLKITASQLDTIQGISSSASPTFAKLGLGVAVDSYDILKVQGTTAYLSEMNGTQTATVGNGMGGIILDGTLSPSAGVTTASGFHANQIVISPTAQLISEYSGFLSNPVFSSNVATITNAYGFNFGGGTAEGGSVGTGFGIRIAKPLFGTSKITARFEGRTQIGTSQQFDVSDAGVVTSGTWNGTIVGVTYGGTGSNLSATGGTSQYLKQSSSGAAITVGTIPASDIGSGAALTKTDDTNVTLTLGGTPSTALLAATSLTLGWTGQLALTRGGLNASLTASNGGIFYSTASAGAILAGTATANQMLQSGASTTPAWSTTTWPATTTINRLLWSSAANVISDLATANNGTLITSSGGVPSISSTLPNAVQDNITRLGTIANIATPVGVAFGGTSLSSGTSGGLLYFSGTGTIASSGSYTAGAILFGNGTGNAPSSDSSDFSYDSTNHRLKIGSNAAVSGSALTVSGHTAFNNADITIMGLGSGNGATVTYSAGGTMYWQTGRGIGTGTNEFSIFDSVAVAQALVITTGGNITLGINTSSQLTYNGVTTTTANAGGTALPALVQGFMDIIINGTHRKVPYYLN